MPKKYPAEVHDRAVRMALGRLGDYPLMWAACQALAPNVGADHLKPPGRQRPYFRLALTTLPHRPVEGPDGG